MSIDKNIDSEILLAQPRGFCAGVDRAISIVNQALEQFGAPIYVRHEIVHNKYVVDDLRSRGAIFIDDLKKVPKGATLVFSAHGVPPKVKEEAQSRGFRVFDATCPLVTKVHVEVVKMYRDGYYIVMIGHKGHPEVEGTMGQVEDRISLVQKVEDVHFLDIPDNVPIAYVTQTTLSIDETADIVAALKNKYPQIAQPKKQDICYATQNRQDAIKEISGLCDLIIIVGSQNSSNSNRLKELALREGVEAYMIDHEDALQSSWLLNKKNIGISAGASAPEISVKNIVNKIESLTKAHIRELPGVEESVVFRLPKI